MIKGRGGAGLTLGGGKITGSSGGRHTAGTYRQDGRWKGSRPLGTTRVSTRNWVRLGAVLLQTDQTAAGPARLTEWQSFAQGNELCGSVGSRGGTWKFAIVAKF